MIEISKNMIFIGAIIWLFVCALRGYYIGFLRELYIIAEIVLALVCLWAAMQHVTVFQGGIPTFGGFLVIMFVLRWVGRLLGIVNHIPVLGGMNRTLGVLTGFFQGLAMLGLAYSWLGNSLKV